MFSEEPPLSVLDHISQVLPFGQEVVTGRRNKRYWKLGNKRLEENESLLTGQVGWESRSTEAKDKYDEEAKAWVDAVGERGRSARVPFVFDGDDKMRTLAILKHPTFTETTLPVVFKQLLEGGESARITSSTEWDVEPIGDTESFRQWLRSTKVTRVRFVAKRPNPDGLDALGPVWDRIRRHRAREIRESMEAADSEDGLADLEDDPIFNSYMNMSERAWGYATAEGFRGERRTQFDQRAKVARRRTDDLPRSWRGAIAVMRAIIFELRRQRDS